jgi:hypothetical protein
LRFIKSLNWKKTTAALFAMRPDLNRSSRPVIAKLGMRRQRVMPLAQLGDEPGDEQLSVTKAFGEKCLGHGIMLEGNCVRPLSIVQPA